MPRATRRCEVSSRPPWDAARPDNLRRIVTNVVSKIGMNRTKMGTASTGRKLRERPPERFIKAELARKNPINIDPQSPMKIEARCELYTRKARSDAAKAASISASIGCPPDKKLSARKPEAIAAIPAASPSMLSSRLIALVIPTSQKIVKIRLREANRLHG